MAMVCPPLSLGHAASTSSPRPSLPLIRSSLDKRNSAARLPIFSTTKTQTLRLRSIHIQIVKVVKASTSGVTPSDGDDAGDGLLEGWEVETSTPGTSFLAKLAIALGIAATVTLLSVCAKWSSGTSNSLPVLLEGSSPSAVSSAGFTLTIFGQRIILPEYAPGWVYFWLLMAAGCGLFISEEALNIWVGISLTRNLSLNGNWQSFASSFSRNSPYIISTVLWVYWGVCISDMIPFYLGRFFRNTKASESICTKLGIGKEKAVKITEVVRKYGNLIGFVERFSVGVRNPTAFLAGAWVMRPYGTSDLLSEFGVVFLRILVLGISSECFFAGVCCGGLVTLPIQLAIGFLLRERPAVALASVGTIVGVWTVFPYLLAASTTLFLFIRNHYSQQNSS